MPALPINSYLFLAKEVTWGVNPGVGAPKFMSVQSENLKATVDKKVLKAIIGSRNVTRQVALARKAAGAIKHEVDVENGIGDILRNLLVTESVNDFGVGLGGNHLFTPGQTTGTGLTAVVCRDTSGVTASGGNTNLWAYTGGKVKKVSFSAKDGETLQCTTDMVFKDGNPGATGSTPAYTTQNPLLYHTGTFTIDGTAVPAKSFELSIDGGILDGRGKIGSNLIQEPQPGLFAVTGSMELYYDDMVQVLKYLNNTVATLVLTLTGAAIGANSRTLKFEIPTCFFNGETPTVDAPEPEMMQKIPFEAIKNGSGAPDAMVRVSLLNSQRTAY